MSVDGLIAARGVGASTTRPALTQDAGGSVVMTYASSIASLQAFVQRASPSETVINGARRMVTSTIGYILAGQDVLAKDRLSVGSETWEVTGVRTPDERTSEQSLAYTILSLTLTTGQP